MGALQMSRPALIILGGLPGVGKTTIARELLALRAAAYVRIDAIEQALLSSGRAAGEIGPAGYRVAYEVARSHLALGLTVVVDCVNPVAATRQAWRAVAASSAAHGVEVELLCSDAAEHRRRVEGRRADIAGHVLPTWEEIVQRDYEPWTTDRLVIDTALVGAGEAARRILASLAAVERSV